MQELTQHNKKVDRHQNGKMKKIIFHKRCISKKNIVLNYIFENKSNYFFYKSGVRFEIWTLLFFMASSDLSTPEVRWKSSNFIMDFDVEKGKDFGVPLSESINFDHLVTFHILQYCYCKNWNMSIEEVLNCLLFQSRVFTNVYIMPYPISKQACLFLFS